MLFLVVIFLIFTFSALALLLLSVNFYRETVESSEKNENARGATAYIREVIHQNDNGGGVELAEFDGIPCLRIQTEDEYILYIYQMDGKLKELYTREGAQISAGDGQNIMELKELTMEEVQSGVFSITCEDASEQKDTVIISEKSSAGGGWE
jgi:hypothetical protein